MEAPMNIITPTNTKAAIGVADDPSGLGDGVALLRLQTWLSPSFPVGAYTYSHGVETAIEAGLVGDVGSLTRWVDGALRFGTGRLDGAFFRAAWEGVAHENDDRLACAIIHADTMRGTRELALESEAQGKAFLDAVEKAWDFPALAHLRAVLANLDRPAPYPVAVGAIAAGAGIALKPALRMFLHAFAANIVSAGVRLVPLGQSDGLRALAALEDVILEAAKTALKQSPDDLGAAAPLIDWASMKHETQYTRLFRS